MKARLTALLSALLLFSAIFGTPVARVSTYRASTCYVYCEQSRDRAEEIVETMERPRPEGRPFTAPAPRDAAGGAILDFSLFQRPPPALSM